ncbi:hypothetical protein ACN47E_000154 [Coniothyrium glycines]
MTQKQSNQGHTQNSKARSNDATKATIVAPPSNRQSANTANSTNHGKSRPHSHVHQSSTRNTSPSQSPTRESRRHLLQRAADATKSGTVLDKGKSLFKNVAPHIDSADNPRTTPEVVQAREEYKQDSQYLVDVMDVGCGELLTVRQALWGEKGVDPDDWLKEDTTSTKLQENQSCKDVAHMLRDLEALDVNSRKRQADDIDVPVRTPRKDKQARRSLNFDGPSGPIATPRFTSSFEDQSRERNSRRDAVRSTQVYDEYEPILGQADEAETPTYHNLSSSIPRSNNPHDSEAAVHEAESASNQRHTKSACSSTLASSIRRPNTGGRKRKNVSTIVHFDLYMWVPGAGNGAYHNSEELDPAVRQHVKSVFENVCYKPKSRKDRYGRITRNPSTYARGVSEECVCHHVISHGSASSSRTFAHDDPWYACDNCIKAGRPCIRIVLTEDVSDEAPSDNPFAMCMMPLPTSKRDDATWDDVGFWMVSDRTWRGHLVTTSQLECSISLLLVIPVLSQTVYIATW